MSGICTYRKLYSCSFFYLSIIGLLNKYLLEIYDVEILCDKNINKVPISTEITFFITTLLSVIKRRTKCHGGRVGTGNSEKWPSMGQGRLLKEGVCRQQKGKWD